MKATHGQGQKLGLAYRILGWEDRPLRAQALLDKVVKGSSDGKLWP